MATSPMKVFGALLVALCLVVPLVSASAADVKYCNKKAEPISGGKLVIDVSYFGFHIHSEDHDLCEETTCPIAVGDFVVAHTQELPGITPPGSYSLKMTMVDGNKKQLTCINFDFSIGFLAEESSAVM